MTRKTLAWISRADENKNDEPTPIDGRQGKDEESPLQRQVVKIDVRIVFISECYTLWNIC